MEQPLEKARENLIYGVGAISSTWGYSKLLGQLYGLLYLNEEPMPLEQIAGELGVSKGSISLNVREGERLGMVRKVWVKGDRRDFYEADPNLWKIIRRVTRERQKKEFEFAFETVSGSLRLIGEADLKSDEAKFIRKRLTRMASFFKSVNTLVSGIISLETLKGAAIQSCPVRSRIPKLTGKDW